MIKRVQLTHFKKYENGIIELNPESITLLIGANNSGKSTIIQALAIWEFCHIIIELEEGADQLLADAANTSNGHGMSSEEFLPLALPALNHLWTNLKPQAGQTVDYRGYTLQICCIWDSDGEEYQLEFSLSLTNDRLFIKVTRSTLTSVAQKIPRIAYLPTFAGILPRENFATPAERKAALGRGLAGSILRNIIYEMYQSYLIERTRILGTSVKLSPRMKKELRENSSWEKLQQNLREIFLSELEVKDFNQTYQTVIRVNERRVTFEDGKYMLSKMGDYTPRDVMSQGSGYLQWLSIFSILFSGEVDVLLLDEPDAHLHATLQAELLARLSENSRQAHKQIIIATHSIEMIHEAEIHELFSVDKLRYLQEEKERTAILNGIGSPFAQREREISQYKKIFFAESNEDVEIVRIFSEKLGEPIGSKFCCWVTTKQHSTREDTVKILNSDKAPADTVVAVSLRDRDLIHRNDISHIMLEQGGVRNASFCSITWKRRHLECYLFYIPAIARAAQVSEDVVNTFLRQNDKYVEFTLATFVQQNTHPVLADCDVKKDYLHVLCQHFDISLSGIAKAFLRDEIPEDVRIVVGLIRNMFGLQP